MALPTDIECLWTNPDQAGILRKHGQARKPKNQWEERFFVLKGSILYFFKSRNDLKQLQGIIPLERARIQAEAPAGHPILPTTPASPATATNTPPPSLYITITLHIQFAYAAKHPFYVLLAPNKEAHATWLSAMRQATIPRSTMLSKLNDEGDICEVVASSTEETHVCFPTPSPAVISSSTFVRLDQSQALQATAATNDGVLVPVSSPAQGARSDIGSREGLIPSAINNGGKFQTPSRPATEIHASSDYRPPSSGKINNGAAGKTALPGLKKKRDEDPISLRTTYGPLNGSNEIEV